MTRPPSATETDILTDIDAQTARRLIESASDIALVLDARGGVLQAHLQDIELSHSLGSSWEGKAWAETVTDDSREKIGLLMGGHTTGGAA